MATSSTVLLRRFLTKAKFRHMEVLIRVAELGSMRKATTALGMTQPSISQVIAELESLMETELFFRHARGVEPTDAARDLLPVARRMLSTLGEGAEIVANRLERNAGLVRVSASEAGMFGILHPVLPEIAGRHSRIQVLITQTPGTDPLQQIAEAACDILCVREPQVVPEGWYFETCKADQLITVCRPGHPIAASGGATTDELGRYMWLMNRVDSIARTRFEETHARLGWDDKIRGNLVVHVPEMTLRLLATGDYLSLIPRSVANPFIADGRMNVVACDMTFELAPLGYLWQREKANKATRLIARMLSDAPE